MSFELKQLLYFQLNALSMSVLTGEYHDHRDLATVLRGLAKACEQSGECLNYAALQGTVSAMPGAACPSSGATGMLCEIF